MSSMTSADWRKVSGLVHTFHEADRDMPSAVLADLGALIGCDVASYNAVDHVERRLLHAVTVPHTSTFFGMDSFHRVFAQHPGFAAYRDGRLATGQAAAWSDLLDRRALRRLPLFVDFFQPRETRDQLLCLVRLDRRQGGILAFNRSRAGFTARERELAETVAGHLGQAIRQRERITRLTAALGRAEREAGRRHRAALRLATLTDREHQVVALLSGGLGDREIAHGLGISERTVHKHLEHIYRKLGLDTRAKVAALVRDQATTSEP
ncbi:LuxR C-terminal-related transcriptional regulator [Actinoplanes sp. NPDC049599]|uniref:LuxR C-terminal-related transcriptional regulator n=1 Tax=Actinoplanes sp. NPDC049599 TaxID=3363903 RepID=UPI00378DB09D